MVDRSVDEMCRDYAEACPDSEEDKILLKREMIYFAFSGKEAQNEVRTQIGFELSFRNDLSLVRECERALQNRKKCAHSDTPI